MQPFFFILQREFRLFFGNKIMMVLYLGGPLLYGTIFGLVYQKGKFTEVPVVVVDNDNTVYSKRLIDMLDDVDLLWVKDVRHDNVGVRNIFIGDSVYALIIIPYHFEKDLLHFTHPEVNTYINNSNMLVGGYVNRSITAVMATLNALRATATGRTMEAFHLNTFRLFNPASSYFMFIWPSYLAIVFQSVVLVVLALSFASEEENKSLVSLYEESHHSTFRIMSAKLLLYFLLSLFILFLYVVFFFLFREPFPLHPAQVFCIFLPFWLTNSFIGMTAGLWFRSQLRSLQFLMILSMPIYISSGFSWPYDQSGPVAHFFSYIFPFMPFVNAFRILLIEHGQLNDIRDYFQIQLGQMLFYFLVAYGSLRFRVYQETNTQKL